MPTERVCVVTGANSGIGKAMAEALAVQGARVVMVCRNADKGEAARAEIAARAGEGQLELERADLGSLSDVRDLAGRLARFERIDALLNNAGLYLPTRQVSPDGYEMMFAVNHLAPFLLTHLLRDKLAASDDPRVVTTSSFGHKLGRFDLDDLQAETSFSPISQYGVTKLANILFTKEAARRYGADGICANCFHPGAVGSGFAQDEPGLFAGLMKIGKVFIRSPQKGAETGIHLATSPDVAGVTGEYFIDKKAKAPSKTARDPELAARLWEKSAELTGVA